MYIVDCYFRNISKFVKSQFNYILVNMTSVNNSLSLYDFMTWI